MKYLKITYIYIIITLFVSISCEKSLEIEPKDTFSEEIVYKNAEQLERLVVPIYNSTEGWGINRYIWWTRRFNIEVGSFEAKFNFRDIDQFKLRSGWTASDVGRLAGKWLTFWTYIRATNQFLDKVDDSQAMKDNPEKVTLLKAEARFLRANIYTKLLKYYGGVPLLKNAIGLDGDFQLVRNSYKECVDFIVEELDDVAKILPDSRPPSEFGRATKIAALAVKSRALLYAASKLHDNDTNPTGPLYDYDVATKWEDASNAAKAVVDLVNERSLLAVADSIAYQNLFLTSSNPDIIFARPYSADFYDFGTDANSLWDQTQSPSGYNGWAMSSVTHNFALLFNMKNGKSTSDTGAGAYDPSRPNENRETRYYANINYNGATFRGRKIEYFLSEDEDKFPNGLDSPKGKGNVLHSSKTGYNIRKFQNEKVGLKDTSPDRPYILYRLAEIYLNYAEAQYHLGNEAVAKTFVNKIITRALQPETTASGAVLLEVIKRERRLELCFEGHNFFDERRWMNEEHLGFDVKGLRWTKKADGTVVNEEYTVIRRPWYKRQYYLPIPSTEIEKAPSLLQNDGY